MRARARDSILSRRAQSLEGLKARKNQKIGKMSKSVYDYVVRNFTLMRSSKTVSVFSPQQTSSTYLSLPRDIFSICSPVLHRLNRSLI